MKADAIDALADFDMTVGDSDMSDYILEGLEREFRLTDFLLFYLAQNNSNYLHLLADIRVYNNFLSFKAKCKKRSKSHKANVSTESKFKKNLSYQCKLYKKPGHAADYCYRNP